MTTDVTIDVIPTDVNVWNEVAEWSIQEWGAQFPGDTAQTYVDLYEQSCVNRDALPKVYVAMVGNDDVVGTVTLVVDDELPNATEPGPWLAALYVRGDRRGHGVGTLLVEHCETEAKRFGFRSLWLYTPEHRGWYEQLGWSFVRRADLRESQVDVMQKPLTS